MLVLTNLYLLEKFLAFIIHTAGKRAQFFRDVVNFPLLILVSVHIFFQVWIYVQITFRAVIDLMIATGSDTDVNTALFFQYLYSA